ncbi:MAG: tetratricopeptide repeat protein [Rhizobiaceae bacterium]|nr:tetratricopeptide repeat protein [Rhizobiaceae bacterium]
MSTEDDNFIREVNEELRSDQANALWKKYGKFIIGGAVAIVLGVAGNVGYKNWVDSQAAASGDIFLEALTHAREGRNDEALAAFDQLKAEGYGSYPVLAKMRAATVIAEQGNAEVAISEFLSVANDGSVADALKDVAKIRAGYLMVDVNTYDEVAAQVEVLTNTTNTMRHSAREILGLSAFKANDYARAKDWFTLVVEDTSTPQQISARAQVILDLIAGRSSTS